MKKITKTLIVTSVLFIGATLISVFSSSSAHSNSTGGPQGRTGSPGDGLNCANGCHTGNNNPSSNPGMITSNIPTSGYVPGSTYTITVTALSTSPTLPVKYGFEVSPQNTAGAQKGTLVVTNASQTQLVGGTKYITHTSAGTAPGVGPKTWTFDWIAPVAGSGAVTFYGSLVFANGNGTNSGDVVVLTDLTVQESANSIYEATYNIDAWSVYPNPSFNKIQIKNNFINDGKFDVAIFDITGRKVKEIKEYNIMVKPAIDISDLVNGIYIVNITTEKGSIDKKIIKK